MNAKEAKEKALIVNTASENSQYAEIMRKITYNAGIGLYEFYFYDQIIKEDVKIKLVGEGYKVDVLNTEPTEPTKITNRISWL